MKRKMTPAEFVKYAADNKLKFTLPRDDRKYPGQQCQDEILNTDFRELHKKLVNEVIQFCVDHNISIDEFSLHADGLEGSINYGSWQACTDSCFSLEKFTEDYKKAFWEADKEFLNNISEEYLDRIKYNQEPLLRSM